MKRKQSVFLSERDKRLSRHECQKLTINVYNIPIDCVDNEKLLGVRIDNSLQYTKHVDDVRRSLASELALLK